VSVASFAFQACSFNHSDISPFRVNDLRAIGRQIIARRRPFRSVRHHPWIQRLTDGAQQPCAETVSTSKSL